MTPEQQTVHSTGEVVPRGQPSARAPGLVRCLGCGEPFQPTRTNKRHCRPSCRAAHSRAKHDVDLIQQTASALALPFHREPDPLPVVGTVADEKGRLSRQCARILARLRQGPATNRELAGLSLKYTGRISDLRDKGHRIEVRSRDHKSGLTVYVLLEPAQRELGEC